MFMMIVLTLSKGGSGQDCGGIALEKNDAHETFNPGGTSSKGVGFLHTHVSFFHIKLN